ncbi:MAG: NADH-quinone oxidoreductase subunit N [Bacteroidota bacterium]|nr:NADH-quinone oxidoreductase subunit N [Bacteroidota bacterium]MDP4205359.1 NADH-quinone oxidoreductase subunit N [Bacteroidota bacterium]
MMINESLLLLRYEGIIVFMIFVLFVLNLTDFDKKPSRFLNVVNAMLFINFIAGFLPMPEGSAFQGFFRSSGIIALEKNVLNLGILLISLSGYNWVAKSRKAVEYYILLLSSLLGLFVMLSSGHILVLYLGLELSSLPMAALAALNTNSQKSSEAGVKYILSSAFSTGVTLFGISLLYGAVGDLSFQSISQHLQPNALSLMACIFMLSGFAFKVSVVPFHFWTADVYEGAPTSVSNFYAVISKGAGIFVLMTVLYSLFKNITEIWLYTISILAALSMTIGNLFALRQNNFKRFLAFSSIAQVGFVLVGITSASKVGIDSVIYFVIIYLLSNVVLFSVIEAISDKTGKEKISDLKGLYKTNPLFSIVMTIALFSLAGVPPTAGFFGKFFLLTSGMGAGSYILIGITAINLVLSLYNYLRIVKAFFIDKEEAEMPLVKGNWQTSLVLLACGCGILVLTFAGGLYHFIDTLNF